MQNLSIKIMIIDDNPNIQKDVMKVLSVNQSTNKFDELDVALFGKDEMTASSENYLPEFQFETASQGSEGFDKIKQAYEQNKPFSLAFVDIRMPPGWDGIKTIQRIWEVDPDIQIVICTAYSDYSWEETVENLGVNDNYLILKKPFDNIAIRQLTSALAQKWLLTKATKNQTEYLQKAVKEKTQTIEESLSLLRSTLESTKDGVLVVDLKKQIIHYNKLLLKILDIPKSNLKYLDEQLIQDHIINNLLSPKNHQKVLNRISNNIEITSNETLKLKNGKILESFSQPHRLNDITVGRVWSFRDVTEQAFLEKKLEHQATHDALTGLPNRILLYDRVKQAVERAKRHKSGFSIFFLDLDRFKLINDSLGHEIGDKLLQEVSKRLLTLTRKEDTISRLGGDEFVMLFYDLTKTADITKMSKKIISSFCEPFTVDSIEASTTTSIGISVYPSNGITPSQLLKNADLAMYKAKQLNNQYCFHSDQLSHEYQKRFDLEADLRNALSRNEFLLLFQPQFDIEQKHIKAVEALIRWKHPKKGLVLPMDFIPLAEESGLIIAIGEWVIREACRQLRAWNKKGFPYIHTAVNIATRQLQQPNFTDLVCSILKEYDIPKKYIQFEITENVIITHPDIMKTLKDLSEKGFKIILDDFGTGNSSLNYLNKIQFDSLKIDKSFISNIERSRSDEVIIEAIIAMGKSLGFKIVAEGVETENQFDFLKNHHCDNVQGFMYSKPLSPAQLLRFLQTTKE